MSFKMYNQSSLSESENNFTNDYVKKRRILLKTRNLIGPIADQAIAKLREKIDFKFKFFNYCYEDEHKDEWFKVSQLVNFL